MKLGFIKRRRENKIPQRNIRNRPVEAPRQPVFSYTAQRSERTANNARSLPNNSPKRVEAPKRSGWIPLICLIVIVIAATVILYSASNPEITIVEPSGFSYQPHPLSDYRLKAAAAISSSILNHNKLTFDTNTIDSTLEKDFPEVRYAVVSLPFIGASPHIFLQLQVPIINYQTTNNNYILDANGVIIAGITNFAQPQASQLVAVIAPLNNNFKQGDQVLTTTDVRFIQTVHAGFAAKGISVNKLTIQPNALELDAYISGAPYYIKFNLNNNDPINQLGTYFATIDTLRKQGITPSQYVDVRVSGRAYYK